MRVRLLSKTARMYDTVYLIWHLSRTQEELNQLQPASSDEKVFDLFRKLIQENIPIIEMIDFVFLLENIPVSLREQLVRHRVGVKVGPKVGMDIIPDLPDSSFWSQSMRVLDMGDFATLRRFFVPNSIKENENAVKKFRAAMHFSEGAYRALTALGIPKEDARNVIPLGATHRIIWKLNLAALKHIVEKRSCWILQLGLWQPIIEGMIDELARLWPGFRILVSPPCMKENEFTTCKFCANNQERIISEKDDLPPCPLYLNYYKDDAIETAAEAFPTSKTCWHHISSEDIWSCCDESHIPVMQGMRERYERFWGRDVDTGKLK